MNGKLYGVILKSPLERGKANDNGEADWQERGVCLRGSEA